MFSTLFSLALLAAPALAEFAISTPALAQCQKAAISWEPTTGPYNLIVVAAEDPCGDALFDLGDHDGTSIHWTAALPAGAKVQLSLEDSKGDEAWSGVITVDKSDDDSCIPDSVKDLVDSATVSTSKTSTSTAKTGSGSTVVVTPTTTVSGAAATPDSDDASPSAVGAAAANPLGLGNGAPSARQTTPVVLLGALAAVLAFSL